MSRRYVLLTLALTHWAAAFGLAAFALEVSR